MENRVTFNEELCKSCSLCVKVCPTNIIILADFINKKGYRPATVLDQNSCISCVMCAQICPDSVITVYRPGKKKKKVSLS